MKRDFLFHETTIQGLKLIEPFFVSDERGYFTKWYEADRYIENGINIKPHESFDSLSSEGVIRGLHFQKRNMQSKLVRCLSGELFDVAVDLRKDSPTFGQWEGFNLSSENGKLIFIPEGFAHGFLSLKDDTIISYVCGSKYDGLSDGGIRWDDPEIGIEWPLDRISKKKVISNRDKELPLLSQLKL